MINPAPTSAEPSIYDAAYSPSNASDCGDVGLPMDKSESQCDSNVISELGSGVFPMMSPDSATGHTSPSPPFTPFEAAFDPLRSGQHGRSEHAAGHVAHPISGFSADANWASKFLLASPDAVAKANLYSEGQADPANYWNVIEHAPVLVHSPAGRMSPEALRTMSAAAMATTEPVRLLSARAQINLGAPSGEFDFTDTLNDFRVASPEEDNRNQEYVQEFVGADSTKWKEALSRKFARKSVKITLKNEALSPECFESKQTYSLVFLFFILANVACFIYPCRCIDDSAERDGHCAQYTQFEGTKR
jgi:hypothetical protein